MKDVSAKIMTFRSVERMNILEIQVCLNYNHYFSYPQASQCVPSLPGEETEGGEGREKKKEEG